jgi:hypothetical protein
MDGQLSFATLDYAGKRKRTKRDVFLAEMAAAVQWSVLEAVIAPHYPKQGPQGGRAVMLRIYCLQQWYNLSDPGADELLYDIQSMRALRVNCEATPSPFCRFRGAAGGGQFDTNIAATSAAASA